MKGYNFRNNDNKVKITIKARSYNDAVKALNGIVGGNDLGTLDWTLTNDVQKRNRGS